MVRGEHIGEPHVEIQDALGLVCFDTLLSKRKCNKHGGRSGVVRWNRRWRKEQI
jgi:hypothetical protein